MFGMTEEELRRVGCAGVTDHDDPRHAIALEQRRRTGRVINVELNYVRKNGERFPAEVTSVILPGDPPCRSSPFAISVSGSASKPGCGASTSRAWSASSNGDMNGAITDANDKFLEMVGYSREDLTAGRVNWARMTPTEHRAPLTTCAA